MMEIGYPKKHKLYLKDKNAPIAAVWGLQYWCIIAPVVFSILKVSSHEKYVCRRLGAIITSYSWSDLGRINWYAGGKYEKKILVSPPFIGTAS